MEKQRRGRGGIAGAGGGEGGREGEGGEIVIHRPLQRGTETDVNNSSKSWSNIHRSVGCSSYFDTSGRICGQLTCA